MVADDDLPELAESFQVKLVSAKSGDEKAGSTPTSGASIDPNNAVNTVTVTASDHPYGDDYRLLPLYLLLFLVAIHSDCFVISYYQLLEKKKHFHQLVLTSPIILFVVFVCYLDSTHSTSLYFPNLGLLQFQPKPPGEGLISPALQPAHITVNEEDGRVRLMVARAQGLLGRVAVGYRTTPFTASSPEDYEVHFLSSQLSHLSVGLNGSVLPLYFICRTRRACWTFFQARG